MDAVTHEQQQQAFDWLLSAGHVRHCEGMTLDQVMDLFPLAAGLVALHATLIAQGRHPHLSPTKAASCSCPVGPPPTPPRLARPPAHPHRPKHYFDARSAAAGDLVDQEDD